MIPVVTQRQGVTLFAWNRGAVLEDRFLDRVVKASGSLASTVGAMNQAVSRLIRSCPENLARPARSPAEREPQRKMSPLPRREAQGEGVFSTVCVVSRTYFFERTVTWVL